MVFSSAIIDVCGDILRHDAAGADDGVFTDGDAGKNDGAGADPYVVPDVDVLVELQALRPQVRVHRMRGGRQGHVGRDEHLVADVDVAVIHRGQVEVDEHVVPEMEVGAAPVGAERQLNVTVLPALGEYLFHESLFAVEVRRAQLVEVPVLFHEGQLDLQDILIIAVIEKTLLHAFEFGHGLSPYFFFTFSVLRYAFCSSVIR